MNFPFRRGRSATALLDAPVRPAHVLESTFSYARCRFELACSCGDTFSTPYIDEALEYRELHQTLAPLADQLPHL